jgi:hypothetical protein
MSIPVVIEKLGHILASDYAPYEIKRDLFAIALDLQSLKAQPATPAQPWPARFRILVASRYNDTRVELFCIDGKITESKIYAIKYIRTVTGMGLKDAKD